MSMSGKWTFGGVAANLSVTERLNRLTKNMAVRVSIETTADAPLYDNTISSPSEVAQVLEEIKGISNTSILPTATPVVCKYFLSKWDEIFTLDPTIGDNASDVRRKIASDFFQFLTLRKRLTAVTSDTVRYAYLGSTVQKYYRDNLPRVEAELARLKGLLEQIERANQPITYRTANLGIETELISPSVTLLPHPDRGGDGAISVRVPDAIDFFLRIKGAIGDFRARVRSVKTGQIWYGDDKSYGTKWSPVGVPFAETVPTQRTTKTTGSNPSDNVVEIRFVKFFDGGNQPVAAPIFDGRRAWNERVFVITRPQDFVIELVSKQNEVFMTLPFPDK